MDHPPNSDRATGTGEELVSKYQKHAHRRTQRCSLLQNILDVSKRIESVSRRVRINCRLASVLRLWPAMRAGKELSVAFGIHLCCQAAWGLKRRSGPPCRPPLPQALPKPHLVLGCVWQSSLAAPFSSVLSCPQRLTLSTTAPDGTCCTSELFLLPLQAWLPLLSSDSITSSFSDPELHHLQPPHHQRSVPPSSVLTSTLYPSLLSSSLQSRFTQASVTPAARLHLLQSGCSLLDATPLFSGV